MAGCSGCKGCNGCAPELQIMSGCSSCSSCSVDTIAYYWISRVESIDLKKIKDETLRAKIEAILKTRIP